MMNLRPYTGILIGCSLLLSLAACSVKESRSGCPCLINVDFSKALSDERLPEGGDSALVIMRGLYNDLVRASEYPDAYTFNVKRTSSLLSVYMGFSGERLQRGRSVLVIPLGEDGDQLFSYHRMMTLDENSEEEYVTPTLCCESTRVILRYTDSVEGPCSLPQKFVATSSTCALDLETGEPLEGEFRHTLSEGDSLSWSFIMPRQGGKDIRIDAFSTLTEEYLFGIDLYEELCRAGYDWASESLAPLVVVGISRKNLPVDVRIIDWNEAVYFNYTL